MFKLLILLLITISVYADEYKKVLVITNYNPFRADTEAFKKGLDDVKKEIERKYPKIKVVYTNIFIDRKNKKLIEKDINKLEKILNDKFLFIVAPGISKAFGTVAPCLPKDTPIITASSAIDELQKFKGNIFSTSDLPRYSKAKDIYKLKKIIKYKRIINVYDKQPGSYPIYILKAFAKDNPDIKIININLTSINKGFLDKYGNDALFYISANGTKSCKIIFDRLNFIIKNLEFLYNKKYNISYYLSYFSTIYSYKNDKKVFSSSSITSNKKNIFEYEYLRPLKYKNEKLIKRYDQAFRWYYPKILLGLRGLENFDLDINVLHRIIIDNLKKTNIYNPFVDKRTRYIYAFEKKDYNGREIYFNAIRKYNILKNYLYILSSGQKLLNPIQIFNDFKYHTIYVTPQIKKLKILTLDATKAKVDLVIRAASINKNFEFGKSILMKSAKKDDFDIKLLSSSKITFLNTPLYYKVYNIHLMININSDLFKFPYDKQIINIPFYPNNFSKDHYVIQMINDKNQYDATISDNWFIDKHFPTYSRQIYKVENGLDKKLKVLLTDINYFTLQIKRKDPLQIILKYFLPAIILLFMAIFIGYFIFKKYSQNHIAIISDVLLGIISIYFIYSLLIQIETLIIMDLVFYVIIFMVILLIISIFILEKLGYINK
ncbi:hypothetical protein [Nitratiruptor sp. YY09-18]|uniref:hypothetical protein n=1 Tax=Nitratiruptor sp. YY09-18 TaxID=2724901 RepID=UPI0019157A76|nr:hypothetical protein [Nitratiruptor sp. YY09-18]BCD67490.1 hypothetical protein NitYY0918_C0383 [Nitratiruptor sp. YY09-18]